MFPSNEIYSSFHFIKLRLAIPVYGSIFRVETLLASHRKFLISCLKFIGWPIRFPFLYISNIQDFLIVLKENVLFFILFLKFAFESLKKSAWNFPLQCFIRFQLLLKLTDCRFPLPETAVEGFLGRVYRIDIEVFEFVVIHFFCKIKKFLISLFLPSSNTFVVWHFIFQFDKND